MDLTSSPTLPPTSDPALFDNWDQDSANLSTLPWSTHSDELEALHKVLEEATARKTKEGLVIQHRAWQVAELFQGDADYLHDTPLRRRGIEKKKLDLLSSPQSITMPAFISSPVTYPPSSSPPISKVLPHIASKPKARKFGGFLDDDSDDENTTTREGPSLKKQRLGGLPLQSELQTQTAQVAKNVPAPLATRNDTVASLNGNDSSLDSEAADSTIDIDSLFRKPVPSFSSMFGISADRKEIKTCSGKFASIKTRKEAAPASFEEMVAARSTVKAGRAKKAYYGIDIHQLIDDASQAIAKEDQLSISDQTKASGSTLLSSERDQQGDTRRTLMWTEKYRARRFFDLVGDDRTHREVLGWLKGWDPIVFPRNVRPKHSSFKKRDKEENREEPIHRKILLLTGPPGLGKTTLAHVCAAQAGYEVLEINASDERSSHVVKGRIRTTVGTESVKTIGTTTTKSGEVHKSGQPVCVVVDEVDGVVSGSGGSGEGGFIKALIDLIHLDAKNSGGDTKATNQSHRKKKGDDFRLLRPLILICNDVYHPSLRPLRQSGLAEIIHIRKPPLEAVVNRTKSVFEREGIACDTDGVRKLCEAIWGMNSGPDSRFDSGTAEGDLRSILVVGEWVAGKLKSSSVKNPRLSRRWVEQNMLNNLSHGGEGTRGVGRGGAKEVVSRVFLLGAGFPKPSSFPFETLSNKNKDVRDETVPRTTLHASEITKKAGMDRLREMVDASGDVDRIVTDIFSVYPSHPFNDDTVLSKPDEAYEWLHFHDACSSRIFSEQEWELMPYLSQPVLACHHLFAAPARRYNHGFSQKKWNNESEDVGEEGKDTPFSGPRADYDAREVEKTHRATIIEMQSSLNPTLLRSFRSPEEIATDLLPYLVRMLTPEVKPVIVGGSGDAKGIASVRKENEKQMVQRAVYVMSEVGVKFERGKLEGEFGRGTQWVYRMEPPLDTLVNFSTHSKTHLGSVAPVRYAVRQVLDQEYQKHIVIRENAARQLRYAAGGSDEKEMRPVSRAGKDEKFQLDRDDEPVKVKKDFFGRILKESDGNKGVKVAEAGKKKQKSKVWVTYHEGFSNAVRKPVTVEDLLRAL